LYSELRSKISCHPGARRDDEGARSVSIVCYLKAFTKQKNPRILAP
jgi:hypothetical protein